jgi:hypothetical protein
MQLNKYWALVDSPASTMQAVQQFKLLAVCSSMSSMAIDRQCMHVDAVQQRATSRCTYNWSATISHMPAPEEQLLNVAWL